MEFEKEKEEDVCVVRAISLEYVGIIVTDVDLSAFGFTRKEGTNKWFNNKYYKCIKNDFGDFVVFRI